MEIIGNDAAPKAPIGGLVVRLAQAQPADYTKATIDAILSNVTVGEEAHLVVGVESVTTEDAEGDTKEDSFGKEYVLFTTLSGTALSFRINAEGYKELKALINTGNLDIFYISGSFTENSTTVTAGDSIMAWYSQPVKLAKPVISENSYDTGLSWSTKIASGGADPFVWENITA